MNHLKTIPLITTIIICVPFLILAFPGLLGATETYLVTSGSMEPAIPEGSLIFVEETDSPEQIQESDVITYSQPSDLPITHRVVDVNSSEDQTRYTTKGDANIREDPQPISYQRVIGEVTIVLPYFGSILNWMSSLQGFILLVAAPILTIIAIELGLNQEETRENEEYSFT